MEPIRKTPVTDQVVASLKKLITSGEFNVGDKLPTEKEICEQLKVGRSTVREALRVLKTLRYIELIPGRGAFVIKVTEDDPRSIANWFMEHEVQITDFMEVRAAIETLAVRLAIPRITEHHIRQLEGNLLNFEKALNKHDVANLIILDEAFHKTIVDATGNRLLIGIYDKVSEAFSDYRSRSFSFKDTARNALEPHQNIVKAIKQRDLEWAIREITNHIRISIEDISKIINKETAKQSTGK